MIRNVLNRALRRFWTKSDAKGLRADWVRRIDRQLSLLNQATRPEDVDVMGYGFHALKGDQTGRFAITVSRNWRIMFGFDGEDAVDIELEDYHG